MGMVTIICPQTGQRVATGVNMRAEEFVRLSHQVNIVRCSACGRMHEWSGENATLQDDDEPSPDGSVASRKNR